MTKGQVEALLTVLLAVFFLLFGMAALRQGRRSGTPNLWRYLGPGLAILTLALLWLHQLMRSMTKAHGEALIMGGLAIVYLAIGIGAGMQGRRSGVRSSWRYVAPIAAVVPLLVVWFNLHGYVFGGPGGLDVTRPRP